MIAITTENSMRVKPRSDCLPRETIALLQLEDHSPQKTKFVDARRLSGHQQILFSGGSEPQAAEGQWFLGEDNPIEVSHSH